MNTKPLHYCKNELSSYNRAVKQAYFKLFTTTKNMLATIERYELRCTLIREDDAVNEPGIIHQLVNPLFHLRLEHYSDGRYGIRYGFELFDQPNEYSRLTALFIRTIYKLTEQEVTGINIESCIHTEWVITTCSDMYEYIEEHGQQHHFRLIRYSTKGSRSKKPLSIV
jgi:hypothetical protein